LDETQIVPSERTSIYVFTLHTPAAMFAVFFSRLRIGIVGVQFIDANE